MANWSVRLAGDPAMLQMMAAVYRGPSLHVYQDGDHYWLESDSLPDILAVEDLINEIEIGVLPRACGVLTAYANVQLPPDGRLPWITEVRGGPIFMSAGRCFIRGTEDIERGKRLAMTDGDGNTLAQRILALAAANPPVARCLTVSSGTDRLWYELYKLLEIVSDHTPDENQLATWARAPLSKVKLLKQTANYHRHAKAKTPPPKTPLRLSEAMELTQNLVVAWLDHLLAHPAPRLP